MTRQDETFNYSSVEYPKLKARIAHGKKYLDRDS
jgi:hypothetical protein